MRRLIVSVIFSYKSRKLILRNRRLVAKYFNFSLGWVQQLLFHAGENKRNENCKKEILKNVGGWRD